MKNVLSGSNSGLLSQIRNIHNTEYSVYIANSDSTMADSKRRFHDKLTGAKARLFAHTCMHYSSAVEDACNDTPDEHPIFCWLSPQQRLQLVHEVMVGLLCPDEPLPPETIQHYTTYLALVAIIQIEIEVEVDMVQFAEVGDDLLDGYEHTTEYPEQTPEEREERNRNSDLISRQAEKNKEKLDRAQATNALEEFQAPAEADFSLTDSVARVSSTRSALFTGPPIPAEARRLNRLLTDDEEGAFFKRRLVDAALQENRNGFIGPLCNVDFDWKCQSLKKWVLATDVVMVSYFNAEITPSEQALVHGRVGEIEYADRSQHARIHAIEKIVKDLRDSYDPVWEPDMLAVDQRAIFAVCSSLKFCSDENFAWVTGFLASCEEQGVDFSAGGDYQKRFDIYRRMAPLYKEGLSTAFHNGFDEFEDAKTPANFGREDPISVDCHVYNCFFGSKENMKLCSRCKVVSYCSRECQMKDWPDHKKHCKVLAELRKDKAKVSEIVKNF
jgi:hypothetical protein